MKEKELFIEVFNHFQEKYPSKNLQMIGTCVASNSQILFNTDGYNLLFNLKRLCASLDDELI